MLVIGRLELRAGQLPAYEDAGHDRDDDVRSHIDDQQIVWAHEVPGQPRPMTDRTAHAQRNPGGLRLMATSLQQ
jgi:hypothetical protein